MDRFVVIVAVVTGVIAYASTESVFAAAVSGLFWGALAAVAVWVRGRWRARSASRSSRA